MFHGNAVIADWAPALAAGAGVALRRRFSASGFLTDVRRYRATYFTYVGRAVQYVLATPERPDDRDNPLRLGFGTEAGPEDAEAFRRRFGVRLVEGYGSSEGGAAVQWSPQSADSAPTLAMAVGSMAGALRSVVAASMRAIWWFWVAQAEASRPTPARPTIESFSPIVVSLSKVRFSVGDTYAARPFSFAGAQPAKLRDCSGHAFTASRTAPGRLSRRGR